MPESEDGQKSKGNKYSPPAFFDDPAEYADYKKKLLRWTRITNVDKKLQAEVVLYHLEGHRSGISETIETSIGDELQDNAEGVKRLIDFLDEIYAEDDMAEAWSNYKNFVRLTKKKTQPVMEFVAEFEKAYKKAKTSGCEISDTVLAFSLLEACRMSETDEKFILTAINFPEGKRKKDMLMQVK